MFTKESLDKLRERIDLVEVVSGHIDLKRAGTAFKANCPFHQEKSPSFMIQKGDRHYHCFGCGAHGDAIQFLMSQLSLSFVEAVETLSEKFHVPLERIHQQEKGVNKAPLKEASETATRFFHTCLVYTEEGKEALHYLYRRGLTLDFIRRFEIGYAPDEEQSFRKVMQSENLSDEVLIEAGLLNSAKRPFFRDRITFPIKNAAGSVIGFSARKYKEETFGGKYINTSETPLFKKSRILFGLNYCRRRITKEKRVLIVEGQIDCLKMIEAGLNLTVASLGTAFGESHVQELKHLGVREAYLIFDGDDAGMTAASKVGHLLQKGGLDVKVVTLPKGSDPDSYLTQFGVEKLIEELEKPQEYLAYQVKFLARELDLNSPAAKAELVKILKKQIEEWEEPVMVHESLKKMATLINIPEEMIGITPLLMYTRKLTTPQVNAVDPHRVLELDLLRWLILRPDFLKTAENYLTESHFWTASCKQLFTNYLKSEEKDLLSLGGGLEETTLFDEILQKKVNRERAEINFLETVQKLLDRQWMQTREEIKMQIHSGTSKEEEVLDLAKKFDELKNKRQKAELIT